VPTHPCNTFHLNLNKGHCAFSTENVQKMLISLRVKLSCYYVCVYFFSSYVHFHKKTKGGPVPNSMITRTKLHVHLLCVMHMWFFCSSFETRCTCTGRPIYSVLEINLYIFGKSYNLKLIFFWELELEAFVKYLLQISFIWSMHV
jgi:hypothetical protein